MKWKKILPMIMLAIPWAFGMLYLDWEYGWIWQYALGMGSMLCLSWVCCGVWSPAAAVAGNLLSFGISASCLAVFRFAELNWYFKPFTALGWAAVLMLFSGLLQWLVWKKQWMLLMLVIGFVGAAIGLLYSVQLTM